MKLSVIIPLYKQVEEFKKNLKANLPYLKDCEIIVVNDDPTVSVEEDLKEFTQIKLIENNTNLGFGGTNNVGVKATAGDFIMLLNSDVVLLDDSYKKAFDYFTDESIFAVTFAQKEKNNEIVGKNRIYWEKGFMMHSKAPNMKTGISGWAEGGSCIIDKKKFNELQGFDPIYSPFYWEDIDLSYRAWKSGYKIMFDEAILVEHHHESTIGKHFDRSKIRTIAFRNQLFCIWKNISSPSLLLAHIINLKIRILITLLKGDSTMLNGYLQALPKVFTVINKRNTIKSNVSDYEIFSQFS